MRWLAAVVGEVVVEELKCPSLGGGDHMPSLFFFGEGTIIEGVDRNMTIWVCFQGVSRGVSFLVGIQGGFKLCLQFPVDYQRRLATDLGRVDSKSAVEVR